MTDPTKLTGRPGHGPLEFVPRTCPEKPDSNGQKKSSVIWGFVPSPHVSAYNGILQNRA
jgi:hypothetical protein